MANKENDEDLHEFVSISLGASEAFSERFTIYIPNKGRSESTGSPQVEIPNWESWIRRTLNLLGQINGGATALAPSGGFYIDRGRNNEKVIERTVLVYTFIKRETFIKQISEVRAFAHEFGHATNQGAVFFDYDGFAYQIEPPYDVLDEVTAETGG